MTLLAGKEFCTSLSRKFEEISGGLLYKFLLVHFQNRNKMLIVKLAEEKVWLGELTVST